jgi:hypothetical protein
MFEQGFLGQAGSSKTSIRGKRKSDRQTLSQELPGVQNDLSKKKKI